MGVPSGNWAFEQLWVALPSPSAAWEWWSPFSPTCRGSWQGVPEVHLVQGSVPGLVVGTPSVSLNGSCALKTQLCAWTSPRETLSECLLHCSKGSGLMPVNIPKGLSFPPMSQGKDLEAAFVCPAIYILVPNNNRTKRNKVVFRCWKNLILDDIS